MSNFLGGIEYPITMSNRYMLTPRRCVYYAICAMNKKGCLKLRMAYPGIVVGINDIKRALAIFSLPQSRMELAQLHYYLRSLGGVQDLGPLPPKISQKLTTWLPTSHWAIRDVSIVLVLYVRCYYLAGHGWLSRNLVTMNNRYLYVLLGWVMTVPGILSGER